MKYIADGSVITNRLIFTDGRVIEDIMGGSGMYAVGLFATLSTLFVLILIRQFEKRFLSDFLKKYRNVKISISCNIDSIDKITNIVDTHFSNITKIERRIANDNEYLLKDIRG